jgi:hypothetical protein
MKKVRENKRYKNILKKREKVIKYDYLLGLKSKLSEFDYEIKKHYLAKYPDPDVAVHLLPDYRSGIKSKKYYKKIASRIKNIDKKLKNVVLPISLYIKDKITMDKIILFYGC